MSTSVVRAPPVLRRFPAFQNGNRHISRRAWRFSSPAMVHCSAATSEAWKKKKVGGDKTVRMVEPVLPPADDPALPTTSGLRFDQLQLPELETTGGEHLRVFGQFVAREALLDEELWTAAWLRAESHWEEKPGSRYVDSCKKKFADQEFAALKRRCSAKHAEQCTCLVAVRREKKNAKQNILKSVVGTLDVSIRYLLHGENFPGERAVSPGFFSLCRAGLPRYGYIANLCVAKYARRQGIASNMLQLAVDSAKSQGLDNIFVHVHKANAAAQKLYEKTGFEMVRAATPQTRSLEECNYLMCLKTSH